MICGTGEMFPGLPRAIHTALFSATFDLQRGDFRGERCRSHAEDLGGATGAVDFAATSLERFCDAGSFEFKELCAG